MNISSKSEFFWVHPTYTDDDYNNYINNYNTIKEIDDASIEYATEVIKGKIQWNLVNQLKREAFKQGALFAMSKEISK